MGADEQAFTPTPRDELPPLEKPASSDVEPQPAAVPAGMFRRMAAFCYDLLLVVALLMVATVPFLPWSQGKPIVPEDVGALAYAYWLWELVIVSAFFGFFWTRRGQTLGMQVWRLRLQDEQGQLLNWPHVLLRQFYAVLPWVPAFIALTYADHAKEPLLRWLGEALLLLGIADWTAVWFDAERRCIHDRLAATKVVVAPKIKISAEDW